MSLSALSVARRSLLEIDSWVSALRGSERSGLVSLLDAVVVAHCVRSYMDSLALVVVHWFRGVGLGCLLTAFVTFPRGVLALPRPLCQLHLLSSCLI